LKPSHCALIKLIEPKLVWTFIVFNNQPINLFIAL
jgi:hypothetical protein